MWVNVLYSWSELKYWFLCSMGEGTTSLTTTMVTMLLHQIHHWQIDVSYLGMYRVVAFSSGSADLSDSIIKLLGQGTFGKVVEAYDKQHRSRCAIKVIRSIQKYRDASRIELRVLSTLSSNDKGNRNKCIHLRDCFDYRNHICIVTDLLGQSVFDFLKGNGFVPFPSTQIQNFARQLFTSVACECLYVLFSQSRC